MIEELRQITPFFWTITAVVFLGAAIAIFINGERYWKKAWRIIFAFLMIPITIFVVMGIFLAGAINYVWEKSQNNSD